MALDDDIMKIATCMNAVFNECKEPPLSEFKHIYETQVRPYALVTILEDVNGKKEKFVMLDYTVKLQGMTYHQYLQHGQTLINDMMATGMLNDEYGGNC